MKLRYKIGLGIAILGSVFLYGRCGRSGPTPIINPVLPPNDAAQITVNPGGHSITVVTPTGSHTTYLPHGTSTIDIGHDGAVSLKVKQFGLEHSPFAGVYYSDALRFGVGADFVYWKKLDLGVGVAGGASAHTVAFAQLSYNVWDNVRVGITYDHLGHVGGGITLRI